MANLSGIKKVKEIILSEDLIIYDKPRGGREKTVCLEKGREYIVPEYQREINWSTENVQILIDDLRKSSKFLGTITLSTSEPKKFEIIDGQQRLTVITLMITHLNECVDENKKVIDLCDILNKSFPDFKDALTYKFDYEKIKTENLPLYDRIIANDNQNQRFAFTRIWKSIVERVNLLSTIEKEDLLLSLCESELNVIVNDIDGTDTQRKFCVDYFIDINNKSVELDSLDIIRAYAFKEDFSRMTERWVKIQKKCNDLSGKVKYTREDLYFQYFICRVNKEIEYKINKLSNDYKIKEDVEVVGKKFASGTYIWNMFKNDKFYSKLLEELDEYLDFINVVISTETGGDDQFKKYFYEESGKLVDETRILNAHTILNSILRNDDMIPKMLVMKYFLEVLKPETVKNARYRIISSINIIATVFTLSTKRKGSEIIASKLLLEDWQKGVREYAKKIIQDIPSEIGFSKVIRENGKITKESGLHAARRYYSMVDACSSTSGSVNEEIFKNENITSGDKNMEHFLINREYSYTLFLEDGKTVDIEINLPKKHKKYISTIANYIIMDSQLNKQLKNRPVYEKIDMMEDFISEMGIKTVIPSAESQKHYYLIKKYFYDESKYPKKRLNDAPTKAKKKKILREYYQTYFEDEFAYLSESLKDPDMVFSAEIEYELKKKGFEVEEDSFVIELDNVFANVTAEIDKKNRKIVMSAELFNPATEDEDGQEIYHTLIEQVEKEFTARFGKEPELQLSSDYCEGCPDESVSFLYAFEPDIQNVDDFIEELDNISKIVTGE